jgi:hypothetical protein
VNDLVHHISPDGEQRRGDDQGHYHRSPPKVSRDYLPPWPPRRPTFSGNWHRRPRSRGDAGIALQDSQDGCDQPRDLLAGAISEQVDALDRRECAAATDIVIRNVTLIEPGWDEPRLVRRA